MAFPHQLTSASTTDMTTDESIQVLHQVGHTMTSCVDDHDEDM